MAFRKQNVRPEYKKTALFEKGEVVIDGGVFEKIGEDHYGKPCYIFRMDDDTRKAVNHCGHLEWLMDEYAQLGDYCRLTYLGVTQIAKDKKKKGKDKDPHTFELEIDADRFDSSFAKHRQDKPKPPSKDDEDSNKISDALNNLSDEEKKLLMAKLQSQSIPSTDEENIDDMVM